VFNIRLDFGAGSCEASVYAKNFLNIKNNIVIDKSKQTKDIADNLNFEFYYKLSNVKSTDFFFTSHSLEHVSSLSKFMKDLSSIITKNGYVFIEVPNLEKDDDLRKLNHAPHTYVFTKNSLVHTFERYGFKMLNLNAYMHVKETSCLRVIFLKI